METVIELIVKMSETDVLSGIKVISPQDVILLLAALKNADSKFPSEVFSMAISEIQANARNDKLCAEIAKLSALIEQRLPPAGVSAGGAEMLTQETPGPAPVEPVPAPCERTSTEPAPTSAEPTVAPETLASAPDDPTETANTSNSTYSSVYTAWVSQNIDNAEIRDEILTESDTDQVVCEYLARHGLLHILKEAPPADGIDIIAAQHGHLDIIVWLADSGRIDNIHSVFWFAAHSGHINILEYMHAAFPGDDLVGSYDWHAISAAAAANQLDAIKWFFSIGALNKSGAKLACIAGAALHGHASIAKYIIPMCSKLELHAAIMGAAACGELKTVQLLCTRCDDIPVSLVINAAEHHEHVVNWIKEMYE